MPENIETAIEKLYEEFYQYLLSEEHYAVFFKNSNIADIKAKQKSIFKGLFSNTQEEIHQQGIHIGRAHVQINLPFEDLYAGYQKIQQLIPKYFSYEWIESNQVYHRLFLQRNSAAEGYLFSYIAQLKQEISMMIDHREKVLPEAQVLLVNKPLYWIFSILTHIEASKFELPEMDADLCPLTELLGTCRTLEAEEKKELLLLHETQHVMGNSFLFFFNEQNYPLAVFLLSRFYGRTLDLSNRIGLAFQLSTIHELQKDPLTGFYLRHEMESTLEESFIQNSSVSILMLDLDHFKHVNDEFGHQAGDKVLQQTAELISHIVRDTDKVFRYGGEEFLIMLEQANTDIALSIAERLRITIEQHQFVIENDHTETLQVTASLGVNTFEKNQHKTLPSVDEWIDECDQKLYQAKQNGRNQVVI